MAPPSHIPVLPLFPDGSLPPLPLLRQWLREAAESGTAIGCEKLPHGNGIIPDLCRWAGIEELRIFRPDLPRRFHWQSASGASITVDNRAHDEEHREDPLPQRVGHLPPCPHVGTAQRIVDRVLRRVEVARLADVAAALGGSMGADWRPPLAALSYGGAPPPLRTQSITLEDGPMRVWNPLPISRRCVAALPPDGQAPPWSVIDHRGAKHPVQVVEGPMGEQWLTELHLGPLEVVDLVPYHEPVGGEHWEVSTKVLDNGWVRAEFTERGTIARLCIDGRFIAIDDTLVQPFIDGQAISGEVHIRPLEQGPTRGRVIVTHHDPAGVLRITYTLHAHEDLLQIAATWSPQRDAEVVLRHPIEGLIQPIDLAADAGFQHLDPSASANKASIQPIAGLRWVQAGNPGQRLALLGQRPMTLIAQTLDIVANEGALYALSSGERSGDQLSLAEAALSLSVPARHAGTAEVAAPAFHLGDHHQLTALWFAKPEGWQAEILLVEQQGRSGQAEIYPHRHLDALNEARLVDADGRRIADLKATKDGDGWLIPFQPQQLLIVRMR